MTAMILSARGVRKTFGGVTALDGVTLSVREGEVHALVGENGAGKSTLGKVLAGIHRPDSGEVRIAGRPVSFHSPADASRAGIGMVHQELAFCPYLSVAEKERLNLLNPPEKTPALFEKYLPYALALNVENAWSEQFAEVLAKAGTETQPYSPIWYSGSSWDSSHTSRFSDSLGSSFAGAISSSSTAPGSSSGSGGGGFSGGGGGGGGGSGW